MSVSLKIEQEQYVSATQPQIPGTIRQFVSRFLVSVVLLAIASATLACGNAGAAQTPTSNSAPSPSSPDSDSTPNSEAAAVPLSITATPLPGATAGSAYSATLAALGGMPPYTWTLASGQLPTGLTLSSSGVIGGMPSVAGTFTFTAQVEDSATSPQSTTRAEGIAVSSSASSQPIPPPQAAGYTLKFADDFDTLSLSPNGNQSGVYAWYPLSITSGMSVNNSILTLNLATQNGDYASAIATNQAWQYGYFEIRMKWPNTTTGAWPALWMLPVGQTTGSTVGENGGEIDIMEGQGGVSPSTIWGTVHEWSSGVDVWNNGGANAYTVPQGVDLSQYHVYGLLWTPGSVSWYIDNQLIITSVFPSAIDAEQYYLILAMQEGVNWTYGDLSGVQASDMAMQIDWVHVWQQQ